MSAHPPGLRLGVDENGLGPRLGPMIVTGALIAVSSDWERFVSAARSVGIGDSKGLCAHGAMREVEATVLAVLDVHLGLRPSTFAELFEALNLDGDASCARSAPTARRRGCASTPGSRCPPSAELLAIVTATAPAR